ncbi:MAG TPA: adenosylcobinamide-phosphate synthase CbiB [Nitrospinota bacterium]|nr:adenosylcobinamide-phosphate synthase CbiB [Nitrospinota bacterium]|tara:strand:- start:218779 stop:219738 length:960 start_codon:yes stop_codon:yes gene_type:complete
MILEIQIIIAFIVDLFIGDPRSYTHPVTRIATYALFLERSTRRLIPFSSLAGAITVAGVVFGVGIITWSILWVSSLAGWWLQALVSIAIMYYCFATHDLSKHAKQVETALQSGDVKLSRQLVGRLVGRDTKNLDETEIIRGCVESVAENLVDGVTAPLFYAALAGPIGVAIYKSVNTMDSLFGYKNKKYIEFGWAPARLDDLLNYIPARITAATVVITSPLFGLTSSGAWKTLRRDGQKHASPNSGLTEAAFAGSMGIRLGGINFYEGVEKKAPYMGDNFNVLSVRHIGLAVKLMLATSVLFLMTMITIKVLILSLFLI